MFEDEDEDEEDAFLPGYDMYVEILLNRLLEFNMCFLTAHFPLLQHSIFRKDASIGLPSHFYRLK